MSAESSVVSPELQVWCPRNYRTIPPRELETARARLQEVQES